MSKNEKPHFNVGVVGYSELKFDITRAKEYIKTAFDKVAERYGGRDIVIVSGLTDLGIPGLAYHEAKKRGYIEKYLPYIAEGLKEVCDLSDAKTNEAKKLLEKILEETRK